MPRLALMALLIVATAACQTSPTPTPTASSTTAPSTPAGPSASAAVVESIVPQPTSPFTSDAYEYATIQGAVDAFAAGLIDQYDGSTSDGLDHLYTAAGLASALAFDWRLRGAVRNEAFFRGEISLRGFSTTHEDGLATPPVLDTDIGFVIAPDAQLVDARTGSVVQAWSEVQYFALNVRLRYDAGRRGWLATGIGPALGSLSDAPDAPGPPIRCPGLGPDLPDDADPAEGSAWCFGGEDGAWAHPAQVTLLANVPCGETRASVLVVGWPIGSSLDVWDRHEFARDPDGGFGERWPLALEYDPDATLPVDGYSTGLTDGEFEIWVSPSAEARAIWARHGDQFERWPRAGIWGVTDCN